MYRPLVMGWFFFSGLAALIYQVLWARQLELAFGSTLPAVSVILSVFMGGLALGSLLFGRLVDRSRNPLRLYAFLEAGIGVYALLTPWIFQGLFQLQLYWGHFSATGVSGFSPMNLLFSALVLLFPTTLMGGTLPVMTRFVVSRHRELGSEVGRLYFINTLGAAAGSVAAGFVMIAAFGLFATTYVAGAINLVIGLLALLFQRAWASSTSTPAPSSAPQPAAAEAGQASEPPPRWLGALLLPAYGLAGFASLALEVLLTRALVLVLGSSVYAFSLMLAAFLVGIAVGSTLIARFIDNEKRNLWLWFAAMEIGIGAAVVALTVFLGQSPLVMLPVFLNYSQTFWKLELVQFSLLFGAMLVPTILMGAAFPIVSKLHAREMQRLGRAVGQVYAVNTLGAIAGPLVAGFVLIPFIGIETSLKIVAYIYLVLGAAFLALRPNVRLAYRSLVLSSVATLLVIAVAFTPSWDRALMTTGVYYHPRMFSGPSPVTNLRNFAGNVKLLFYGEGQLGTVSVIEASNARVLAINGKPEASSHYDISTQLLVGHVPVLLHEKPRSVLMVGLGSGITLGAILQHSELERVDAIEIEPVVAEAAEYFAEANNKALGDQRLRLIFGDARNRVLTSPETYDVIAAEPSNPWVSGASNLFSREMLELYKKRLNEGGVVSQWIHLYSINTEDLKSMVNTFVSVFPYTTIWQDYTYPDIQLVGSLRPIKVDWNRLQDKVKEDTVKKDLARIGADDPHVLLSFFLTDESSTRAFSSGAKINNDNHPRLEFTTPRYLYRFTFGANMAAMVPFLSDPVGLLTGGLAPEARDSIKVMADFRKHVMQAGAFQENSDWGAAVREWESAFRLVPANLYVKDQLAEAYEYLGAEYFSRGELQNAIDVYKKEMDMSPERAGVYKAIAVVAQSAGMLEEATSHLLTAAELAPYDPEVYINLGNVYLSKKEFSSAVTLYSKGLQLSPEFAAGYGSRGAAYLGLGNYEKALADYSEAIRLGAGTAKHYVGRAKVYVQKGEYSRAIADAAIAVKLDGGLASGYENRGIAYLYVRDYNRAIKDLSRAIELAPTAPLYDNRGLAYVSLRQYDAALVDLNKAVETDAGYSLPYYRLGYVNQEMGRRAEAIASYEKFLSLSEDSSLARTARSALERLKSSN
ncbi:MAG: fused MFS/spermidine synthase [Chloroflexi bacterium]|nr:fused MFS/spermidine synthase [Chloroflexota bacterium]